MSTSKLQRYVNNQLSIHFGQYHIRENIRPDWLVTKNGARLELDFLIEELNIAIEVQGIQHYKYTPHFHKTYQDFLQRLDWDKFKYLACECQGIKLFEISTEQDVNNTIIKIYKSIPEVDFYINIPIPNVKKIAKDQAKRIRQLLKLKKMYHRKIKNAKTKERVLKYQIRLERLAIKLAELNAHKFEDFL